MKSLGKPWYTQSQYDQASAVYMRYCCDQALHEGRPLPTQPAKLPLMRPPYGRMGAGVCKAISMHLGIAVLWVRLFFLATTCLFGSGLIAYIFLWMALPVGDPIQQTYIIAGKRSPWQAPLSRATCRTGHIPFPRNINLLQLRKMVRTRNHHLLKIRLHATTERMAIRNLPAKVLSRH